MKPVIIIAIAFVLLIPISSIYGLNQTNFDERFMVFEEKLNQTETKIDNFENENIELNYRLQMLENQQRKEQVIRFCLIKIM